MNTNRRLALAAPLLALALLGACGDDDAVDAADASTTTAPPAEATTTTAAPAADETTTTAAAPDAAAGAIEGPDAEEAAAAVATVFDSSIAFEDKVALIEGGEAHRADHEGYVGAADAVGGITLEPQAVVVDGDAATVSYTLFFAGTQAYDDTFDLAVAKVDGTWIVPTTSFCSFLDLARTPCAAP